MKNINLVRMGQRGITGTIEGMISLIVIIFVFAVSYPIIDDAINTLQASAGPTVDLISAGYLPVMAVVLFISIVTLLRPNRPSQYDQY